MPKRKGTATRNGGKRRKPDADSALKSAAFSKLADWENQEQDYELAPRALPQNDKVESLPIKLDGKIHRVMRETVKEAEEPELESESEEESVTEEIKLTPREQLQSVKEQVADYATQLMDNPEENIELLAKLCALMTLSFTAARHLSILALIPIFKSLAPSYSIRPLSESEKRAKVSKDVAKLRHFEQLLVSNYRQYVDLLAELSPKNGSKADVKLAQVATRAACELCLSSLRFFNFRVDLFSILIRSVNKKPLDPTEKELFFQCLRTLETLLKDDKEHGAISMELTKVACKVIKDKKFNVDEAVINVFLSLSLLEDYAPTPEGEKPRLKLNKKNKVHLSKKQKKARKAEKEIEEEMKKAESSLTEEEREKFQATTLKTLLSFYLELLRAGLQGKKSAEAAALMASVLEGLAKFGALSNVDLLGDFLEVLREIISTTLVEHTLDESRLEFCEGQFGGDDFRRILLAVTAAFALVLNNREVGKLPASMDLLHFIRGLYLILADLSLDADLEFSHKLLRLADPLSHDFEKPAVNVSTKAELLLRALDSVFFRLRNGSVARAVSFSKRLYIALLQMPEKTAIATLKFINKLMGRYGDSLKGIWLTEDKLSEEGLYVLGIEKEGFEVDIERCNYGSVVLWENALLDKHYSHTIKDGSRALMKASKMQRAI